MKTIAVLTSGGDAPGMNACIRAVVRTACEKGMNIYGINRGYNGLMEDDMFEMDLRTVSDIIDRGGTVLHSARSLNFKTEEGMQAAIETCQRRGIEGIVVIGGDGSFRGARDLSLRGIPCIGVPGTIDNDIACTDYTIGFDTCLNTIMQTVDRVRDTSESHDRCTVVEVMGRSAGYLALEGGIAVGATYIIVPEKPYDLADVIARMKKTLKTGKRHFVIVVAEGIGGVANLAKRIEEETGVECRSTILGHIQRGGSPTVRDRVMASIMGNKAVKLLMDGIGNRVIAVKDDKIVDYDIFEALQMKKSLNDEYYQIAHEISI
ncbi:MAG: 6-phosphofructokinase [Ruminococcaceae bacterium]|nr:6-phosphofructokinase [Oscillospiraceae bacterium]